MSNDISKQDINIQNENPTNPTNPIKITGFSESLKSKKEANNATNKEITICKDIPVYHNVLKGIPSQFPLLTK